MAKELRNSMIRWISYPLSDKPTKTTLKVIQVFEKHANEIESLAHVGLISDGVLRIVADDLSECGFQVERGKKSVEKVKVPVLFGENGKPQKSFEADAYDPESGYVVEIEAGRGFTNYHFLKDIFEASMMHEVNHLAIALRNDYRGNNDFEKTIKFIDTLYASSRLKLPLKSLIIIGY